MIEEIYKSKIKLNSRFFKMPNAKCQIANFFLFYLIPNAQQIDQKKTLTA